MSREARNTRNIVCNKGYYLIIDVCNQMDSQLLANIVDIVTDTLSIACSSRGITRIPYFGLASINTQFNILWKLSPLKGNYSQINNSFSSLRNVPINGNLSDKEFYDFLHLGLKLIIQDINDLDKSGDRYEDLLCSKAKIKVVLLTQKEGFPIKYYLSTLLDQLDNNNIFEIQIIEICKKVIFKSNREGIFHLLQIDGEADLERIIKKCLVEVAFDREDVVLRLCDQELKCDIHEIVLDTGLIPFSNSFHMHKEITNISSTHLPDPVMPVYRLEVLERISSSGISESCVFGYPIQLRPSRCFLNSPAFKSNAQRFTTLCKTLFDADEYLIARLINEDMPQGYFVLMPGDCMFLVKSVATKELVLPSHSTCSSLDGCSPVDYELRLEMNNAVFSLPLTDEYNPLNFSSNICYYLRRQLLSRKSKGTADRSGRSSSTEFKSPCFTEPKLRRKSLGAKRISNNTKEKK